MHDSLSLALAVGATVVGLSPLRGAGSRLPARAPLADSHSLGLLTLFGNLPRFLSILVIVERMLLLLSLENLAAIIFLEKILSHVGHGLLILRNLPLNILNINLFHID